MQVGSILSRAWSIAWRQRSLWAIYLLPLLIFTVIFGGIILVIFFASGVNVAQIATNGRPPDFTNTGGLLFALICLYALFVVVSIVVGIIMLASLIAGVNQIETQGHTSFARAVSEGVSHFWRMLGLVAVYVAIVLALTIVVLIVTGGFSVLTTMTTSGMSGANPRDSGLAATAMAGALATQFAVQCISNIVVFAIAIVYLFSAQGIVIDRLGVFASINRALGIIKNHLGSVIGLFLLLIIISWVLIFALVLVALIGFLVLGGGAALMSNSSQESASLLSGGLGIGFICGIPIFAIVFFIVGAVIQVFYSASFTLAYRQATQSNNTQNPPSAYQPVLPS